MNLLLVSLAIFHFVGETTWENLFPCVLNSESNRDFFNSTMSSDLLEDLTTFLATNSVMEGTCI